MASRADLKARILESLPTDGVEEETRDDFLKRLKVDGESWTQVKLALRSLHFSGRVIFGYPRYGEGYGKGDRTPQSYRVTPRYF